MCACKWRGLESAQTNPILSCMCSKVRGETCKEENKQPFWNVNKHADTKMCFCIEHTILKPLKRSAPISESFIRSPHPLYRYNFHFLSGPLLVSLPNAQRHTWLFSDTNPVPVGEGETVSRRVWKCFFWKLHMRFWAGVKAPVVT